MIDRASRYTHVATLQMKDASERMGEALWGRAMRPTATFGPYDGSGPLLRHEGRGP
jgi:hypothetical protein